MVGTLDDGPCAGLAVCSAGKTANIPHHATQRAIQDTLHISAYPRPSGKSRSGFPVPDEKYDKKYDSDNGKSQVDVPSMLFFCRHDRLYSRHIHHMGDLYICYVLQ